MKYGKIVALLLVAVLLVCVVPSMAHAESITFADGSTYYFGSSGAWIK